MALALLGNREPYEPQDMLIIFKEDGTADIASVVEINDERLYAESSETRYSVPVGEYTAYTGRKGRVFLAGASVEGVSDFQRIAALERSTVLRQITHFQDELPQQGKSPMLKVILIAAAVILLIIMMVK